MMYLERMNFILHKFYLSKSDLYKSLHANHLGWISAGTLTNKHTSLTPCTWWALQSFCRIPLVPGDHSLGQGSFKIARAEHLLWLPTLPHHTQRPKCRLPHHCPLPSPCSLGLVQPVSQPWSFPREKQASFPLLISIFRHQVTLIKYIRKSSTRYSLINCTQWANI